MQTNLDGVKTTMTKNNWILMLIFTVFLLVPFSPLQAKVTKVASLDVSPLGVDKDLAGSLSQILASRLGEYKNLKVISKSEMKAMIGFEFEKKSMGCSDDISCLAEIGGALGVDFIVSGTLGRIKKMYILNMMMINIKN